MSEIMLIANHLMMNFRITFINVAEGLLSWIMHAKF